MIPVTHVNYAYLKVSQDLNIRKFGIIENVVP